MLYGAPNVPKNRDVSRVMWGGLHSGAEVYPDSNIIL